jgi:hypothetical protein
MKTTTYFNTFIQVSDFCGLRSLEGISGTSKSTLERASKMWSAQQIEEFNRLLSEVVCNDDLRLEVELDQAVDASTCLVDSTCVEANTHFPVDWVLLRDVARTLLQAITLIRRAGLKHRMPASPEELSREMNRLCIEMTHARRKKDAAKTRKSLLRRMKGLIHRIAERARSHKDLLDREYTQTPYSQAQAERIVKRMKEKLEQVPLVIKQAHERIIGQRQVANEDKILSVYEPDIHVVVRGKAGKEVEFGNKFFLCESLEGFILDYHLYRDRVPGDPACLLESLERQQEFCIESPIRTVAGDRGFDTKAVAKYLEESNISNAICPRNLKALKEQMKDPDFVKLQKRRGSTEARIAIVNNHGGRRLRAKGYEHRAISMGWAVLSHNLWWIARKVREKPKELAEAA